jgi:hypothetical protein
VDDAQVVPETVCDSDAVTVGVIDEEIDTVVLPVTDAEAELYTLLEAVEDAVTH